METLTDTHIHQHLAELAERTFNTPVSKVDPLKGDGSDRRIVRIYLNHTDLKSVVGVWFDNPAENRDFFRISDAFHKAGLAVPDVYAVNSSETGYLLTDLGPYTLADRIETWNRNGYSDRTVEAYRTVLDCLIRIQRELPPLLGAFLAGRRMDVAVFQADLEYFKRDFIRRFKMESAVSSAAEKELDAILHEHLTQPNGDCFVYRDFQARNIMWQDSSPVFIDYQSAFLGPLYYDLASLLFGSKSGLDEAGREILLMYYYERNRSNLDLGFERFQQLFILFVVMRRLRSLGSYGFLAGAKDKTGFLHNISPTLEELSQLFHTQPLLEPFKYIRRMVYQLGEAWTQSADNPSPD